MNRVSGNTYTSFKQVERQIHSFTVDGERKTAEFRLLKNDQLEISGKYKAFMEKANAEGIKDEGESVQINSAYFAMLREEKASGNFKLKLEDPEDLLKIAEDGYIQIKNQKIILSDEDKSWLKKTAKNIKAFNELVERYAQILKDMANAKEELKKPFEKADELKSKVLRLAELNKLLDMGEVEEKRNDNPLIEDVKRAIIDFCNREYEENHSYDEFNTLYPDLKHIGIAYTNTPDERHGIQYELNLEDKTWTQYIDDTPIKTESFDYENKGENEALKNMKNEIEMSSFSDLVYVDSEDLRAATGLDIDDEGNFYDPLAKDLDNDGIPDRYDNDFKDSDYFESTYDVEDNFHIKEENTQKSEDKPSILDQIRAYQNESKTEEKQKTKEQEILR